MIPIILIYYTNNTNETNNTNGTYNTNNTKMILIIPEILI